MSAGWNFVQTGPAVGGQAGGLEQDDRAWQGYVEFCPVMENANGNGPMRVDYLGAVTSNGVAHQVGGTDTSAIAVPSTPTFVSTTAQQLSTTTDGMLYIAITTAAALAVAIGPTSGVTTTMIPSATYGLSVISIRVPKGWFVKVTGTVADQTYTFIPC